MAVETKGQSMVDVTKELYIFLQHDKQALNMKNLDSPFPSLVKYVSLLSSI